MVLSVHRFILISQPRKSAHKSYFAPLQNGWEVKISHRTGYIFIKICCENAPIPKLHLYKLITNPNGELKILSLLFLCPVTTLFPRTDTAEQALKRFSGPDATPWAVQDSSDLSSSCQFIAFRNKLNNCPVT